MKNFNSIDLLIWLQEQNALEAFLTNTKNALMGTEELEGLIRMGIPAPMLFNVFIWEETPEGPEYWRDLEEKCFKYLGLIPEKE